MVSLNIETGAAITGCIGFSFWGDGYLLAVVPDGVCDLRFRDKGELVASDISVYGAINLDRVMLKRS